MVELIFYLSDASAEILQQLQQLHHQSIGHLKGKLSPTSQFNPLLKVMILFCVIGVIIHDPTRRILILPFASSSPRLQLALTSSSSDIHLISAGQSRPLWNTLFQTVSLVFKHFKNTSLQMMINHAPLLNILWTTTIKV